MPQLGEFDRQQLAVWQNPDLDVPNPLI